MSPQHFPPSSRRISVATSHLNANLSTTPSGKLPRILPSRTGTNTNNSSRRPSISGQKIEAKWEKEGTGITGDLIQAIERARKIAEEVGKKLKSSADHKETLTNMLLPRDVEQLREEMSAWRMRYMSDGDKMDAVIGAFKKKHGRKLKLGFSGISRIDPVSEEEDLGLTGVLKMKTRREVPAQNKGGERPALEKKSSSLHRTLADSAAEQQKKRRRVQQALKKLVGTCGIIRSLIVASGQTKKKALKGGLVKRAFPTRPFQSEKSQLFFAEVAQGDLMSIRLRLNKDKYLVYDFDFVGRTALHLAARKDNVDVLKELLSRLADPNASDISGRTPLYVAAKYASIAAVKLLLEHKANPTFMTKGGLAPLDVAHTHLIKEVLQVAVRVYREMSLFISKEKKEGTWKHVCTLNFMPSNSDQNDFELDAIPESLRKALERGKNKA